jgi:hypothetical protein
MLYDQTHIDLAREAGAPDPEGNARRAREILSLLHKQAFSEAKSRLKSITNPAIREDLRVAIEFDETCRCIPTP